MASVKCFLLLVQFSSCDEPPNWALGSLSGLSAHSDREELLGVAERIFLPSEAGGGWLLRKLAIP